MNQFKTSYVLNRLKQLEHEKLNVLEKKLLKPAKELTDEERFKLLKAGKVKLQKDRTKVSEYDDIRRVFDFSPFEWEESHDDKTYDKKRLEISQSAQKVRDEIVLGDEQEALELLKKFEDNNL